MRLCSARHAARIGYADIFALAACKCCPGSDPAQQLPKLLCRLPHADSNAYFPQDHHLQVELQNQGQDSAAIGLAVGARST